MSKIISGIFKGIKLDVLPQENMRPTSCRAKEALFDILQFNLKDKIFVDLFSGTGQIGLEALSRGALKCFFVEKFSGTGQIGLEALSRGALKCFFVEKSKKSIQILMQNINRVEKISDKKLNFEVCILDVYKFLDKFNKKADILFADSPFDSPLDEKIFVKSKQIINPNGILIIESESKNEYFKFTGSFYLIKRYTYGRIAFDFYKLKSG